MENQNLLEEILDFCAREGRFREARELAGMAASGIPGLFFNYFDNLSEMDKIETARILVLGALDREEQLSEYLPVCGYLLLALCARGYQTYLKDSLGLIETEYQSPNNLRVWLVAGDSTPPAAGAQFKKQWRYAIWLRKILGYFHSPAVVEVDRAILDASVSNRFKEALRQASLDHDL